MELKKTQLSIHFLVATALFILYITLIPGMEGLVFRKDSNNNTFISYNGILSMLRQPFTNKDFWRLDMLDLNYLMFLIIYFLFIYILVKYVT